jgi:hypothetical protein
MRLPPYGAALAERMKFNNPPLHAVVCVGMDCWQRAKLWNKREHRAMVLPADTRPEALAWPVSGLPVVLDVSVGPSEEQLSDLALALLQSGSEPVTQWSPSKSHPFKQYRWSEA